MRGSAFFMPKISKVCEKTSVPPMSKVHSSPTI
nr:MAG TPA: hypothetical protein [Caudoviricetes sp.]DAO85773.1 MAG TPA: hypothetical protein [Caudoviricetes sp.]